MSKSKARVAIKPEPKGAPAEIRRLCDKVADQGSKGLWWNALAAAMDLVRACQDECRAEVESVIAKRVKVNGTESSKKKAKKKGEKKKKKKDK